MNSTRLGRYELLRLLATGGMGEVLLARRDDGPTLYAVKRLLRHLAKDQGAIDLFANEARIAGKLHHPHIARVFDFAGSDGSWFIAMEYVHGPSLRAVLEACLTRNVSVPPRIAALWIEQALEGLVYAHTLFGLIHGDVSPENILVTYSGEVKLVDFGLARAAEATPAGRSWGKVRYTAPEKIAGLSVDGRSDVFAVGHVLRELLTRDDSVKTGIPAELLAIAARASAERVENRYGTAEAMLLALKQWTGVKTPSDQLAMTAVMTALFGDEALQPIDQAVSLSAPAGPFGTQPLIPVVQMPPVSAPVVAVPPVVQSRRSQWPLVLSGVIAGMIFVLTFIWLWPKNSTVDQLPVTVSGPNDVMMPELELSLDDDDGDVDAGTVPLGEVALSEGFLTLHTRPNASVFVNGRFLGTTPLLHVPVPSGRLVLLMKAGPKGPSKRLTLNMAPGRHIAVSTRLGGR